MAGSTLKYGQLVQELFARPRDDLLRRRIDEMPNPEYQRLLCCDADQLRQRLPGEGPDRRQVAQLAAEVDDATLLTAIRRTTRRC